MSHESYHDERDILFLSSEQVRAENALAEAILEDFPNDEFAWPVLGSDGDANAVQRMTIDGQAVIAVTQARIINDNTRVRFNRYMLNLHNNVFSFRSELEDVETTPTTYEEAIEDLDGVSEVVNEMLFDVGFNHANMQDWESCMATLNDGLHFLDTLRSLSRKIGIPVIDIAMSWSPRNPHNEETGE